MFIFYLTQKDPKQWKKIANAVHEAKVNVGYHQFPVGRPTDGSWNHNLGPT